jgi:hypothetical protein
MRNVFYAVSAAASLLAAATAGADQFNYEVALSADSVLSCSFSDPTSHTGALTGISSGFANLPVAFNNSNPPGISDQSASITFSHVICNGANTKVKLSRSGMNLGSGPSTIPGFNTKIDYTVAVNWGSGPAIASLDVNNNDNGVNGIAVGPRVGDFVLNIHVPPAAGPFAAGTYSDILTLAVEPTT